MMVEQCAVAAERQDRIVESPLRRPVFHALDNADDDHNAVVGGEFSEIHGGRCRQSARIGGEHVPPGRHDVAPLALRRAGGAGRDPAPVQCIDQAAAFALHARRPGRIGKPAGRRAPVNVLAVLDREIFQVAEPRIDPAQRVLPRDVQALVDDGARVKDACAQVVAANPGAPSRRQLYDAVLRARESS